jgi:hypothetical protein
MKLSIEEHTLGTIPLLEVVLEDQKNKKLPLIIYYHGWQSSKELTLTQGRYLAREGFRVLLPDALNHGKRKMPMTDIPSLTFWQTIHTNLFEFGYLVDALQKRNLADDRIGVGGLSMGGMTTTALLTHHPEINAAACVMGSPKLVAYRERIFKHASQMERFFPKDYNHLLSWIPEYDLSLQPEKIDGRPLLFWHGKQDVVVPYNHVVEFVEENQDLPNMQFIEEDEDHLVKPATMEKITQFFVEAML